MNMQGSVAESDTYQEAKKKVIAHGSPPMFIRVGERSAAHGCFVPSEWQLAACRSGFEAGINLKLGSFRQNGKIADLTWKARNPGNRRQLGLRRILAQSRK